MGPGGGLDGFLRLCGVRGRDRLEGVDWEGIEEFVGYYEGSFLMVYLKSQRARESCVEDILPEGTKRIFSVQIIGKLAYLLIL